MNDELIKIYRRYFGPGSGFEDEDPSSCTFFSLALSFEDTGETEKAEDLLRLAVADETVCGRADCSHCGPKTWSGLNAQHWVEHWAKEGAA